MVALIRPDKEHAVISSIVRSKVSQQSLMVTLDHLVSLPEEFTENDEIPIFEIEGLVTPRVCAILDRPYINITISPEHEKRYGYYSVRLGNHTVCGCVRQFAGIDRRYGYEATPMKNGSPVKLFYTLQESAAYIISTWPNVDIEYVEDRETEE